MKTETGSRVVGFKQESFDTNRINTSRYTLLNFIPLTLFTQLKKVGILYWVLISILQMYPTISSVNWANTLAFLLLVIAVGILMDLLGKEERGKLDENTNNLIYWKVFHIDTIARNGFDIDNEDMWGTLSSDFADEDAYYLGTNDVRSGDIQVGDLLWLKDDEVIPADCVILKIQNPKLECQIQASQLDGERSYKTKYSNEEISNSFEDFVMQKEGHFYIRCDLPDENIYHFDGQVEFLDFNTEKVKRTIELSHFNFLPRGAILRSSGAGVIAVVAYTGKETKFHFNQGKNTSKVSRTEKQLNKVYCYQILLTILLSFGMTQFGSGIDKELTDFWNYLDESFVHFWRFFVLLARFVPLEVLLIVEISKIAYSNFIEWDAEMIAIEKSPSALQHCSVLSKHLIEELSEVHHVFFDKTGTLTKNELKFRAIVFNGTVCR